MNQPASPSPNDGPSPALDPFELDRQLDALLDRIESEVPGTVAAKLRPNAKQTTATAQAVETLEAEPESAEDAPAKANEADSALVDDAVDEHIEAAASAVDAIADAVGEAEAEAMGSEGEDSPGWVAELESVLDEMQTEASKTTEEEQSPDESAAVSIPDAGVSRADPEVSEALDEVMQEAEGLEDVTDLVEKVTAQTQAVADEAAAATEAPKPNEKKGASEAPADPAASLTEQLDDLVAELEAEGGQAQTSSDSKERVGAEDEPEVAAEEAQVLDELDAALAEQVEAELEGEFESVADITGEAMADLPPIVPREPGPVKRDDVRQASRAEGHENKTPDQDEVAGGFVTVAEATAEAPADEDELDGDFESVEQATSDRAEAADEAELEGDFESVEQATSDGAAVATRDQKQEEEAALAAMGLDDDSAKVAAELDADAAVAARPPRQASVSEDVEGSSTNRLAQLLAVVRAGCAAVSYPLRGLPSEVRQTLGYIGLVNLFSAMVLMVYAILF
ncbi:hypothetical protein [Mucisphaera sp.]|uniref:hypothetical protein n=1 Tax=Mucisphaera sp. TaxID=2913024 RepID=UPI003D11B130